LIGGAGSDQLFGGPGRDAFVFFGRQAGRDFIGAADFEPGSDDFNPRQDVLRFVGGPDSVDDLTFLAAVVTTASDQPRPTSTIIRYEAMEVVVFHATVEDLRAASYEFFD